jgi:aspartyl/asparaginyl beta-hydroxylase (cupin superfamily)
MMTEGARAVDAFAVHIAEIPRAEMLELADLAKHAPWREIPSRAYDTADVKFWQPCSRAFFIRIPPGGDIQRHHDDFIPGSTHHLVLATNEGCENWWVDRRGRERCVHLRQGHRYLVERSPLHWAFNRGSEDRIHLLVEFD